MKWDESPVFQVQQTIAVNGQVLEGGETLHYAYHEADWTVTYVRDKDRSRVQLPDRAVKCIGYERGNA
jgi:hypothetical protein